MVVHPTSGLTDTPCPCGHLVPRVTYKHHGLASLVSKSTNWWIQHCHCHMQLEVTCLGFLFTAWVQLLKLCMISFQFHASVSLTMWYSGLVTFATVERKMQRLNRISWLQNDVIQWFSDLCNSRAKDATPKLNQVIAKSCDTQARSQDFQKGGYMNVCMYRYA